jgi:hypothetical protein
MAQIENDTLAKSENPKPRYVNTIGNVEYKSPPKKLSRALNLILRSRYNPITPNMNNPPSTTKIVLTETYPNRKIKDIIKEKNGGLNNSEYPVL